MNKQRLAELLEWCKWECGGVLCSCSTMPVSPRPTEAERAEVMNEWRKNPDGRSSYASTLYTMVQNAQA